MAGCRFVLASRSCLPNVGFIPNQNQLCLSRPRYHQQPLNHPREVYKKSYEKQNLFGSMNHVNMSYSLKDEYDWKGTTLLITGASKGIGSHVVRMALREGVKEVVNLDIDDTRGLALQSELNMKYGTNKVFYAKCDVSDEEQLQQNFRAVLDDKDKTYVVVNNAGILNDSFEKYKKEIDINVGALVTGSLTALELMRKDKNGQGGAIINISSVAALCPLPFTPIYNATKSAVLTFSLGLGNEEFFSRTGVRVMTICFGITDTTLNELSNMGSFDKVIESKFTMALRTWPGQKVESAAQAVIDMFKLGDSGSTWLSNANKPAEDITYVVKKAYSLLTEPIFTQI